MSAGRGKAQVQNTSGTARLEVRAQGFGPVSK